VPRRDPNGVGVNSGRVSFGIARSVDPLAQPSPPRPQPDRSSVPLSSAISLAQPAASPIAVETLVINLIVVAPIIMAFDPNLAKLFSGISTLIFFAFVGGAVPSNLGSSFAFIGPVATVTATATARRTESSSRSAESWRPVSSIPSSAWSSI
jgi:Permease family